jgi:hypothetical protein
VIRAQKHAHHVGNDESHEPDRSAERDGRRRQDGGRRQENLLRALDGDAQRRAVSSPTTRRFRERPWA